MAVKHIMRYLKGTFDFKLCLGRKDIVLKGYCNADWMGDANDLRSIMRHVFFVGVGAIMWKCKKQPTIALIMTNADYIATNYCIKKMDWLRQLLADLGYVRRTDIHHVRPSRMHSTCKEFPITLLHQT